MLKKTVLLFLATSTVAGAIDVDPSKTTVPRNDWDTGGNHFDIFRGDPKRIQKANEIDPKSFDTKLEITPDPLLLKTQMQASATPSLKITFSVHNHVNKSYTLSFPTAQRWDFKIMDAKNTLVYGYTEDHEFVQVIGTSLVDFDDKLVYTETIAFSDLDQPLAPGVYTVQAVMANYPLIKAETHFTVGP